MSESDPIVDEVRRIRDAHAAKFNNDPDAIFQDIKEQEKRSGRKYVSLADETVAPNKTPQPTGAGTPDSKSLEAAPAPELLRSQMEGDSDGRSA